MFLARPAQSTDNVWRFDPQLEQIYNLILNLQADEARLQLAQLKKVNEFHKIYIESVLETADILITEDEKRFEKINDDFKNKIDKLAHLPESAETLFLIAELNLQRGFNLLNLGQELNAVLAIRQAYQATQDCIKDYPSFLPIKKTYGVLQVMVGSVPDKYQWFMSLLGMKGSVKIGQKSLDEIRLSQSSLSKEASIVFFSVKGFINQQYSDAAKGFRESLITDPDNRLLLFLSINMFMKDSHSEEALQLMQKLDQQPHGLSMIYVDYLRAEATLHKGDYPQAILYYQKFLKGFKSQSYRKDSHYKMSLCYYLLGNKEESIKNFESAKRTGRTSADPDKYAAAMLESNEFPNPKILKVRFFTDGGYYAQAKEVLASVTPSDLQKEKDATEFYYRKGRLAHKTLDLTSAKSFYQVTIEKTGNQPWYFAPNSALQLGYISQSQGDLVSAKKYFQKALSYKRYEYKNGIDTKARSALEQLEK